MALFSTRGSISYMSDVMTGTGKSGTRFNHMDIVLEVPGYQGMVTKQAFHVFGGSSCDEVTKFNVGDKVDVSFALYAREYNGRWYNSVDLVRIKAQEQPAAENNHEAQVFPKKEESVEEEVQSDLPF